MQEAEASQHLEGYKPLGFSKADFGNLCSGCRVRRGVSANLSLEEVSRKPSVLHWPFSETQKFPGHEEEGPQRLNSGPLLAR